MVQFYCHTFLSWKYPYNLNLTIISFSYQQFNCSSLILVYSEYHITYMQGLTFSSFEIMEQKEFLFKIQLPLFVTNAKVWFFSTTIILGAEVCKKQMKPTTKQTSKCISVLPILRRIWQDWNYMYSYMYLRIFPCCIHSDCFFIVSCGRFKSF